MRIILFSPELNVETWCLIDKNSLSSALVFSAWSHCCFIIVIFHVFVRFLCYTYINSLVYLEPYSLHVHSHGVFCSQRNCVEWLQFLNTSQTAGLCSHACSCTCSKDLWHDAWRLWQIIKMHRPSSLMQIPSDVSAVFRWNRLSYTHCHLELIVWQWSFVSLAWQSWMVSHQNNRLFL